MFLDMLTSTFGLECVGDAGCLVWSVFVFFAMGHGTVGYANVSTIHSINSF